MNRYVFLVIVTLIFALNALAQITLPQDPEAQVEWIKMLSQVFSNYKNLTAMAWGLLAVLVLVQLTKSKIFGKLFKNVSDEAQFIIVTTLGFIYAVIYNSFTGGESISVSAVALVSAGGAGGLFKAGQMLLGRWIPSIFGSEKKQDVTIQI